MARTHIVLDDGLLDAIDAVAGRRGRSQFIEQAAREKLKRLELEAGLLATAGMLDDGNHPEWSSRQRTAMWVRNARAAEQAS